MVNLYDEICSFSFCQQGYIEEMCSNQWAVECYHNYVNPLMLLVQSLNKLLIIASAFSLLDFGIIPYEIGKVWHPQ